MLLATTLALVLPVLVGFVVAAVFEGIAVLGVEDGGGGVEGLRDGETTPKKSKQKKACKNHTKTKEKSKALQLCVELRDFLSEVPFLRESVGIYSYILVRQI